MNYFLSSVMIMNPLAPLSLLTEINPEVKQIFPSINWLADDETLGSTTISQSVFCPTFYHESSQLSDENKVTHGFQRMVMKPRRKLKQSTFRKKCCPQLFATEHRPSNKTNQHINLISMKYCIRPNNHWLRVSQAISTETGHSRVVYSCGFPGCNISTQKIGNINHHFRKHDKLKPYRCHICLEKGYTQVGNLKKHYQQMHPNSQQQLKPIFTDGVDQ